jgi:hypothetical protein
MLAHRSETYILFLQDDDDLDAQIAKYKAQDAALLEAVVEEDVPAPSPRAYASFTPLSVQV